MQGEAHTTAEGTRSRMVAFRATPLIRPFGAPSPARGEGKRSAAAAEQGAPYPAGFAAGYPSGSGGTALR